VRLSHGWKFDTDGNCVGPADLDPEVPSYKDTIKLPPTDALEMGDMI